MSKSLKVIGDNIILKAVKKVGPIVLLDENNNAQQKKQLIDDTRIYAVGNKLKDYKVGQKVVIDPRTIPKRIDVEGLLGIKKENEKDNESKIEEVAYYVVKEENIIAVIN